MWRCTMCNYMLVYTVYMQVYMEAADEEGDENGRIDFPEFLAVMAKVIGQLVKIVCIATKGKILTDVQCSCIISA